MEREGGRKIMRNTRSNHRKFQTAAKIRERERESQSGESSSPSPYTISSGVKQLGEVRD